MKGELSWDLGSCDFGLILFNLECCRRIFGEMFVPFFERLHMTSYSFIIELNSIGQLRFWDGIIGFGLFLWNLFVCLFGFLALLVEIFENLYMSLYPLFLD